MIESDITGTATADCHQPTCEPHTNEIHPTNCACECCCQIVETDCQDNLAECSEAQQLTGGMKMRSMTTRIMSNCALLLALIGLSAVAIRADEVHRANAAVDPVNHINIVDKDVTDATISVDQLTIVDDAVIEIIVPAHGDARVINPAVDQNVIGVDLPASGIADVEILPTRALEFHKADAEIAHLFHLDLVEIHG